MRALSLGTLLIAVIAASALLDPDNGFAIWRELRGDLATSSARVDRLIAENEALESEIAILESEPAALDRAIREELDLALPGEVVVHFEPAASGSGARGAAGGLDRWNEVPAPVSAAGPGWDWEKGARTSVAPPESGGVAGDESEMGTAEELTDGDFQDGESAESAPGGAPIAAAAANEEASP